MPRLLLSFVLVLLFSVPAQAQTTERSTGLRIALVAAATADVVTTRIAIRNGGREANGLLTRIIGPQPSTLKLVGVKLAAIGLIEASSAHLRRKGQHGLARANYWIATLAWAWASGWNLQWAGR